MTAATYPSSPMATQSLFFRKLEPPDGWDGGRAAVSASQRARMLEAVVRAVADRGYARVTVADVVGLAGVSRRTFYEHFEDKQECFLAAYRTGVEYVVGEIGKAGVGASGDWRSRLRAGLDVYTAVLASEPTFARTMLIDLLGAGEEAVALRQQLYELFVERYRALSSLAAAEDPRIEVVPDMFLRALVGGIGELVQQHILREGAQTLPALTPTLVQIAETVIEFGGRRA
jgi:AcrR family transcriptional regulator